MDNFMKGDHEHGRGWVYQVIKPGSGMLGSADFKPSRILADCTSPEARDAAYRLLSGQCEQRQEQ